MPTSPSVCAHFLFGVGDLLILPSLDRFDSMSKIINDLQPPDENPSKESSDSPSDDSSSAVDERGTAKPQGTGDENPRRKHETGVGSEGEAGDSGATGLTTVDGGDKHALSGGEGRGRPEGEGDQEEVTPEGDDRRVEKSSEGLSEEPESEEDRMRREEVEMLDKQRSAIMMEMLTCSHFHHVFEDSNADDGLVPDMPGDDDEGGGDAPSDASSTEGSEAEEGSSGVAAQEKETKEDRQQSAVEKSTQK